VAAAAAGQWAEPWLAFRASSRLAVTRLCILSTASLISSLSAQSWGYVLA